MKNLGLSILMVVAFVISCLAQPKIQFEQTTYDFGRIREEGGKVTGRFTFTNVGTEDLVLTNVRPGCGCTAANYSHDPVAPGQQGYIEATYNPYNRPGGFTKNIRVTTNEPQFINDEKAAPHMIFIKGEVIKRPPTRFEESGYTAGNGMSRIKNNGVSHNLLNNQTVNDTFYVKNFWTKPVSYTLQAEGGFVTEVYRSFGASLQPDQEGFIVLKYDASKRAMFGQVKDRVFFTTNDTIESKKEVNFAVNIKEDFSKMTEKQLKKAPVSQYSAAEYDFGEVAKNSQQSANVTVTNSGKTPLLIRRVVSGSGYFTATSDVESVPAGGTANITIKFNANSRAGAQKSTIEVITNDPKNPNMVLNVKAQIQ